MTVFPMLAISFIMNVVAVLFVICCVSLVLIILIQKGRGGGLSGAFGGAMAGGILGSKTGDFLTWVTIVLVGVFLLLAVVMAKFYKPSVASDYDVSPQTQQQPLQSAEQPEPTGVPEETAGQTGAGADINSPDS
ncbi:MAG: preprotein translocase subunit SecG [Planctomycetota bacterium]|jgi:preprotein translocase subunit SecG